MRISDFFALCCSTIIISSATHAQSSFSCGHHEFPASDNTPAAAAKTLWALRPPLPSRGPVQVLVLFAGFAGEVDDNQSIPRYASDLFDGDRVGSLTHFYDEMSSGQLQVQGVVSPRRYASDSDARTYLAEQSGERGDYGQFVGEILRQADADLDFGRLDNDGPDGQPNSGDDDGVADFVFVSLLSVPRGFLIDGATGIANLGLEQDYTTNDLSANGQAIRVSAAKGLGTILQEGSFTQTAGIMAHEFAHGLGLPDLYDLTHDRPDDDSAGIGRWGLMGLGTLGWTGHDGPNPLSAWSREQLGWIGVDNEGLIEVAQDTTDMVIPPIHAGGIVAKIRLASPSGEEYLLLEHRGEGASYGVGSPAHGMLVWHVNTVAINNDNEQKKLVDLVCADGLYVDAGYPTGAAEDPFEGRDNLDFWAHATYSGYATDHRGNQGDSTDPFDGVRFTRLDADTNPSTTFRGRWRSAYTGPRIGMRAHGEDMIVAVRLPRWGGTIQARERVRWTGDVIVDADLRIDAGGTLFVFGPARIRLEEACEVRVEGELRIFSATRSDRHRDQSAPVVFEAATPAGTWAGIATTEGARVRIPDGSLELRDTHAGLVFPEVSGAGNDTQEFGGLLSNYPNPFNPQTTIRYHLNRPGMVRLTIHNSLGQTVRTLVDGSQTEGEQAITWDARTAQGQDVASGVYLYHLVVEGRRVASRQMLLTR